MLGTRLPRLGTRFEIYAAQFGPPTRTAVIAGCILRRYVWQDGELNVLFADGVSIAVHHRYAATGDDQQARHAVVSAAITTDRLRTMVYCGDTGWTHALRNCPRSLIEALYDVMRGERPASVLRECIELRLN